MMGSGLGGVKARVFVSYHHRGDQAYYDMFSRTFGGIYEMIEDHSLDHEVDSDNADYVMRVIREQYITGSSCTIVLCGADTWGRKHVDWEIKATLMHNTASSALCCRHCQLMPTIKSQFRND